MVGTLDGLRAVTVPKESASSQDTTYYNRFTVKGTVSSRAFFRIVA
jgi:hypothetical protein